jgi:arsenite methyltransferase
MTPEMVALARRNAAEAGATNVEFREGQIEAIPLPDDSVDVVISNCVINLSPDRPTVFAEMFRVVRAGGRIGISDIVAEDHLTAEQRVELGATVGCIIGAPSVGEYEAGLREAGFVDVTVTLTQDVGCGVHSAIIKAAKASD